MTLFTTLVLWTVLAAEDTEFDENAVTPGVIGFLFTAGFAVAVILLGADLVRRIRRSQYRAEIHEELAAELAEREAAQGAGQDPATGRAGGAGGAADPSGDPKAGN